MAPRPAPIAAARPVVSRPATCSTVRSPVPTIATCSTGQPWSDREPNARGGDLAGLEQEVRVDLVERFPGVRIEERHGGGEEALLVPSGGGAAVSAVAQIGEMPQQGGGVLGVSAVHARPTVVRGDGGT